MQSSNGATIKWLTSAPAKALKDALNKCSERGADDLEAALPLTAHGQVLADWWGGPGTGNSQRLALPPDKDGLRHRDGVASTGRHKEKGPQPDGCGPF